MKQIRIVLDDIDWKRLVKYKTKNDMTWRDMLLKHLEN